MISGVHAIIFSRDADAVRAFLRDVLEFPSVDAGDGWPIFALPSAELAAHPTDDAGHHELYLMCDDIEAAIRELERKGVEISGPSARNAGGGWLPSGCPTATNSASTSRLTQLRRAAQKVHSSVRH
jgi:catechol 2,3-dioxygenase-like lactoylglutathione lyase family enzyme